MTAPSIQLVKAIFEDDAFKIKSLIEQGFVNANDSGFFNLPPLLRAALYGKSRALKALIDHGADKNIKNKQGQTALTLAKKHNHPEIVKILLQD